MLQTEVLRPWIRMSFDTFRLGLQVQSSMMSLFKSGQMLMTPAQAQEVPSAFASALAGTPYAPEVVQAVADEIASESAAAKPRAARAKSRAAQRAKKGAQPAAKKPSARKAPSRSKS